MVDGKIKKQITLESGVVQTVDFDKFGYEVSLAIVGTGTVAYKVNGTITSIDDDEANILNADIPAVDVKRSELLETISFISDASMSVQWEGVL